MDAMSQGCRPRPSAGTRTAWNRRQRIAVAGLVCASVWCRLELGFACSFDDIPEQGPNCSTQGAEGHTSVVGARLELQSLVVRRSQYAPPGEGDCGELGRVTLQLQLKDTAEWPGDVGALIDLAEGNEPLPILWTAPDTGWRRRTENGEVL